MATITAHRGSLGCPQWRGPVRPAVTGSPGIPPRLGILAPSAPAAGARRLLRAPPRACRPDDARPRNARRVTSLASRSAPEPSSTMRPFSIGQPRGLTASAWRTFCSTKSSVAPSRCRSATNGEPEHLVEEFDPRGNNFASRMRSRRSGPTRCWTSRASLAETGSSAPRLALKLRCLEGAIRDDDGGVELVEMTLRAQRLLYLVRELDIRAARREAGLRSNKPPFTVSAGRLKSLRQSVTSAPPMRDARGCTQQYRTDGRSRPAALDHPPHGARRSGTPPALLRSSFVA